MRTLLIILSFCGLALTVIPSMLVFGGFISFDDNKTLMLAGTVLWFLTAPFWLKKKETV